MIRLSGLSRAFGDVSAVDRVDLDVRSGEVVALLGPSGCGKTTLLRLIAGFEVPDAGSIEIAERTVAHRGTWVAPEHRGVGMVFQEHALFPHLTVERNIGYGLSRSGRSERVRELVDLVGLTGLERRYPNELSGGQQQRVAIARALAPRPALVLLDEPWSSVDPILRESVRDELVQILRFAGATVVLVTHDRDEAFSLADRVALMRDGTIVQCDAPEDLYLKPSTAWAAEFLGPANLLSGEFDPDGQVSTPVGAFPTAKPACQGLVRAVVRPELIELQIAGGGSAEVVGREFRGHDVLYRVRLGDGTTVISQRPSNEIVPLGARVTVHVHAREIPVF
jgi:iron(III) transport system ATP-binding protein